MKTVLSKEVQDLAERQAAMCRLFGTAQRVLILWLLSEDERTVSQIACAIGSSLSSTSQHLRLLELSKVVESRREHQNIYYHLADTEMFHSCRIFTGRPKKQLMEVVLP